MSLLRQGVLKILGVVSDRVFKNDLFEQKGEREKQTPLQLTPPKVQSSPVEIPTSQCVLASSIQIKHALNKPSQWLLINHWATWCDPCIEEFPILKKMKKALTSFTLIGISWDLFEGGQPPNVLERVSEFSHDHDLGYGSWLVVDSPDLFFENLDIEERKVPQTWVVSPQGERLLTIVGVVTDAHISQIQQLQKSHNGG